MLMRTVTMESGSSLHADEKLTAFMELKSPTRDVRRHEITH